MEYEKVLKDLGSFGPYQRRVFVLVSLFETPAAWAMLLPIFLGHKPEWTCLGLAESVDNSTVGYNKSSSGNASYIHINGSTHTGSICLADGGVCPGIQFVDDFTSIVSEVCSTFTV